MNELVPRHAGRGNDSLRRLRVWLATFEIELVTLSTHTVDVPQGDNPHAKAVLRHVVEARSQ